MPQGMSARSAPRPFYSAKLSGLSRNLHMGYESKERREKTVFISNRNNVKGLEFPFVICFMQSKLDEDLQNRNSIYMMLTRSFITSYFLMPNDDEDAIEEIEQGISFVNENGHLHVKEPNAEQKKRMNNAIIDRSNVHKSQHDIVEEIMAELKIERRYTGKLHNIIKNAYKDELDYDKLYEVIQANYRMMN